MSPRPRVSLLVRVTAALLGPSLLVAVPATAQLRVVTTIPDFAAITRELGGSRVTAEALVKGSQDPHFADARPSMILAANRAQLLVVAGLGLESGWLPVVMTQARNPSIQLGARGYLDASQVVQLRDVVARADRAMGDVHGGGNPHFYTSPAELHRVAKAIHARLVELDPEGRATYDAGWTQFDARYRTKTAGWLQRLAPLKGTAIVEYHKSWVYFLAWSGIRGVGALEPKPGIPPSPAHVAKLLAQVAPLGVKQVWQEVYQPQSLSKLFAQRSGATLLILPSMVGALPGTDTIWAKFDRMVDAIAPR